MILGIIAGLGSSAFGQFDATRISGSVDNDVPIPIASHVIATVDPAAAQVIAAHFQAIGATPWTGMQAQGTLAYSGVEGSSLNAELLISGMDKFRLNVSSPNGTQSTIIRGHHGVSKAADGSVHGMLSSTALLGLVQFHFLRRASFANSPLALLDRGVIEIDGAQLHRISIVVPPIRGVADTPISKRVALQTIDFYFDPKTYLLIKTVSVVRLQGQGTQNFLRVITYSDYRQADNTLIPFRMEESLNGEPQWVLQLAQVQLTSAISLNDFDF
jgi:hypothetical protein